MILGFSRLRRATFVRFVQGVTATFAMACAPFSIAAADYPDKTVTIIVPFNAGGPTDVLARVIGAALSKVWDKPVVIDNRPGATGAIGAHLAASAKPDGYTLLLGSNAVNGTNELMRPKTIPYKTEQAFRPIVLLTKTPTMLCVRETLGVKTLEEFIVYAKANPGRLNYATTGIGGTSHFATELMNLTFGIQTTHIPFTGAGPATQAVLSGVVDFNLCGGTSISPGQLPLAVFWHERLSRFPNVPTMAERGFKDIEYYAWYGLFAPKATPDDVVSRIEKDAVAAASEPALNKRLDEIGFEPTVEDRAGLQREIRDNFAKASKVLANTPALQQEGKE